MVKQVAYNQLIMIYGYNIYMAIILHDINCLQNPRTNNDFLKINNQIQWYSKLYYVYFRLHHAICITIYGQIN